MKDRKYEKDEVSKGGHTLSSGKSFCSGNYFCSTTLTGHNRVEAVGLKTSNYIFKKYDFC